MEDTAHRIGSNKHSATSVLVTTPKRSINRAGVGKVNPRGFTLFPSLSANVTMLQLISDSELSVSVPTTCKLIVNMFSDNTCPFGIIVILVGDAVIFSDPP